MAPESFTKLLLRVCFLVSCFVSLFNNLIYNKVSLKNKATTKQRKVNKNKQTNRFDKSTVVVVNLCF